MAFITSPLTFSFPDINSRCAFALPLTNFPKSSSERESVTVEPNVSKIYESACESMRQAHIAYPEIQ